MITKFESPLRFRIALAALALLACFAASARADVSVPAVLGDGMVMQRQTDAPLWGWASPGETVRVFADWGPGGETVSAETTADADGRWMLHLATPDAGGPYTLKIQANNTVEISDVMVGEVWLCSGQSNMEWPLARAQNPDAEIAAANHPHIRLFTVPNVFALHPRSDCDGAWTACTPDSARTFSAVGYFFGRRLHEELGVPIGLISADWGGTVAEAWMSPAALARFPQFESALAFIEAARDPVRRTSVGEEGKQRWWRALDRRAPDRPQGRWTATDYDASAWKTMRLPATLAGDGLDAFDGLVYFRRKVDLPPAWAGKAALLELGPIDDRDEVWVNGRLVGATREDGQWGVLRRYTVPAGVLANGENVIAIRLLDTGGPGGVNGTADQMRLVHLEGSAEPVALAGPWRYHRGAAVDRLPAFTDSAPVNQNTPTALYHGMISPIRPFGIRGVVWYQGESNRTRAEEYATLFPALIENWRADWGRGDFPFYYVQIAPFLYGRDTGQAALLRESQAKALSLPNTGMVVTMDIGNPRDIHPRNKQDVGTRLARWALAKTYGQDEVVFSGPLYASLSVSGNEVRLTFEHAEGLEARGGPPSHFIVAGEDRRFFRARTRIEDGKVVVWSPLVENPEAVRYAWEAACSPNLFNGAGLPAAPFRTDDWEGPTGPVEDEGATEYLTTDPEFQPLFNGRDLDGWVNVNCAPSTWTVQGGMIVCSGVPTGELRTERQYENFVLEVEWRHLQPGGNAGIFVWSDPITARGQPFTRSVEVQVMDGAEGEWFTSDGDIFPIHGARMTPENGRGRGSRAFPTEKRMRPAPEWNHYRIVCRNGEISLAVNGKVVTRGRDASPRMGYICLESEGTPVHFRNLKIRELPPSGTLEPEDVADEDEGFVSLYTGTDLSGWKTTPEHEGHWRPANWILDFDGNGPHLWTERSYGDFVLICDWRWKAQPTDTPRPVILPTGEVQRTEDGAEVTQVVPDAGDSGILLRGSQKSQVNIWCWPVGSGEVWGYRTDGSMPPEVKAAVTPRVNADAEIGRWNRFVITMKGDRLTVVLNGQTVIENAELPGVPASGPIGLQRHGSPIQFANLYVKELR